MGKRPLVVLLGDSVLIDGIAARWGENEAPEVIHLNTPDVCLNGKLADLEPDMVVFELDSPYAPPAIMLLRGRPGTKLVGLDLDSSRVILMDSHQRQTHSIGELVRVIQAQAGRDLAN